jgi:hypothetical protein
VTAQGEDILAWLENAISLREAAATAAATPYGGNWVQGFPERHKDPDMHYGWDADMVHLSQNDPHMAYQCLSDEIAALTVLYDPESVLRRCAADRKLLELHAPQQDGSGFPDSMQCRTCSTADLGDGYQYLVPAPCPTVLAVAEGYGWTGGER